MIARIKHFFTRDRQSSEQQIAPDFLQTIREDMRTLIADPTPRGLERFMEEVKAETGSNPRAEELFSILAHCALEGFSKIDFPTEELKQRFYTELFARTVLHSVKCMDDFSEEVRALAQSFLKSLGR